MDLNLFRFDSTSPISFTAGTQAFTGTLTLDLSSVAAFLPTSGSGEIVTGYLGNGPNTPIGQWEIATPVSAPEPASWVLLLVSIALVPAMRRLRRA